MGRALIIVLDSVGCGGAEDAADYGDEGADTLGHIAERCAQGEGDRAGCARAAATAESRRARPRPRDASLDGPPPARLRLRRPPGQWGYGVETSRGKDTPSGHWEIAGTPVDFAWGYFPATSRLFPHL